MPTKTVLSGMSARLEPMAARHVPGLAGAARSGVFPFTPVPLGRAETRAYVARARAERKTGASLAFTVIDRRDGRIVGATRFRTPERWTPGPAVGPDAVEIGDSWLGETARSGIDLEVPLLMLRHAFDTWGVRRVSFRIDTRDHRSRAALEKLGVLCAGERHARPPGPDDAPGDVASYSVLAQEWPAVREIIGMRLSLQPPVRARRPNVPARAVAATTEVNP
ncbi:GNAT family N-acetyltransferase [Streptomyces sp. NPDC090303]|uniref:GNAT family N-acetyltransferase n=1 Tax=Streptomyces sp. NPDC090303 TaxID=3365960 RepID=UPI003806670D